MEVLNRTMVTLVARPPFLEWIQSLGDDCAEISLDEVHEDSNAYLIPEIESEEELMEYFETSFKSFLESELADWVEDDTVWPERRTFKAFQEYFDVHVQTVVYDMGDSDLVKAPL